MTMDNDNTPKAPIPFDPPTVPVALESGLIPIEHYDSPIKVNFPVWPAAEAGYTYMLEFDGKLVPPEKSILETDKPGDVLELEIPVALLSEGFHTVAYRTYSPSTGVEDFSDSTPIQIDKTAPGSPQLGPILLPPEVQDGLTSDELEAMNNVLPGRIAGYTGMAAGDVIRTWWGTVEGPLAVVDANDMGLQRVMVDFPRALLEQIGDGQQAVHYTVTDLAGNLSMDSDAAAVELKLSVITPLPLPTITEAQGDILDPANTANGVTVVIAASANLRQGDTVKVGWNGPKASDEKEKAIAAGDAGNALSVVFARALVSANVGESVAVSYQVTRANGMVQDSDVFSVRVQGSLSFDTSAVTLDGKVYLVPAHPEAQPQMPAGTTIERQASGGTAPYSYRSSDPLVAHVSNVGLVSVRGRGTSTISVTDASGQSLSFQVTVSGVVHCIGLSGGKFGDVGAQASANGARLPSIEELREIHGMWAGNWPLVKNLHWSSTPAKVTPFGKTYYQKSLANGVELDAYTYSSTPAIGVR
jgi:hypothetical protein